jgi:hypothetical protein
MQWSMRQAQRCEGSDAERPSLPGARDAQWLLSDARRTLTGGARHHHTDARAE